MTAADHDSRAGARVDLLLVRDLVEPGSRVLDCRFCGDGLLQGERARGIA